jgi:hypothetical protein
MDSTKKAQSGQLIKAKKVESNVPLRQVCLASLPAWYEVYARIREGMLFRRAIDY